MNKPYSFEDNGHTYTVHPELYAHGDNIGSAIARELLRVVASTEEKELEPDSVTGYLDEGSSDDLAAFFLGSEVFRG